jgi:uncharacterized protein YceK
MLKKITLLIIVLSLSACASVKEKTGGLNGIKGMTDTCPPKAERTLKNIFCKEAK